MSARGNAAQRGGTDQAFDRSALEIARLPTLFHRWRALDLLYRSQVQRLTRLFIRRAYPQDAADLVQETFARYTRAVTERALEPECPERYLTRVAVNVLRDHGRYAARRVAFRAVPIEEVELAGADVEAALEATDMLNRVAAIMARLKPRTRDIFIARRFHGYSRAEIAAQTGLSIKAVDKHLARAVDHLHAAFQQG